MKSQGGAARRAALALSIAAALAAVAGCGSSSGSSSASSSGKVTLTFFGADYGTGPSNSTTKYWDAVATAFHQAHPSITVNVQTVNWTDFPTKSATLIQNKQHPDIMEGNPAPPYAQSGLIYPVSDVLSPSVAGNLIPKFLKDGQYQGVNYGIPFTTSTRAMYYNKKIFAAAGISAPPKTWTELQADAAKIKAKGDIGYGMPLGSEEAQAETAIWFYGAGGGYGDAKKLTIDSSENVEGATEMQKIITQGFTEANPGSTNRTPLMNVFIQGQLGMQVGLPPIVGQIKDKNPSLQYGIAPIPTKDGSSFTLGVADHLMAFKNKTDKTDAITKFLDYFYSKDVYTKWVSAEGFLPTTKSGADAMSSDETIKPFLDLLPDAKFYPSTNPNWSAAQGAIQSQIGQLGQGAVPADLLKSIQAKADGQ